MKHYLFELTYGEYEGEEFIVGAETWVEAKEIARDVAIDAGSVNEAGLARYRFWHEMTEEEAEASGLDEY